MRPGIYRKGNQAIVVEKADLTQMQSSIEKIKQAGYRIPAWMEHPGRKEPLAYPIKADDAEAIQQAESDPYFSGWVESGTLDQTSMFHVDIDPEESIGKRLEKTGTYVSPQFGRFKLPDGTILENALHHIALTRNPVNPKQSSDFIPKKSESGVDHRSDSEQNSSPLQMSKISEALDDDEILRFSLGDAAVPNQQTPNSNGTTDQGTGNLLAKLTEALQAMGIQLAADSPILKDPESMGRVLSMIVDMTAQASRNVGMQANQMGGNPNQPPTEQATVIAMSKETPETPEVKTPVDDINVVQMSQLKTTVVAQQSRIDSLMAEISNNRRKSYNDRIDACVRSGRCSSAKGEALKNTASTYQFSGTGDDKSELDTILGLIEEYPEGAMFTPDERAKQFSEKEIPISGTSQFFHNAEVDDARVNAIVDEYCSKVNPVTGK